ncbi:molybdate ABC transporter substrate-binding protein [Citricoccus sp. SGAir0253]|uniref:molybdate ABC transporter substrate-binding protein n=1 Tax=Citricoccus sp. SGAir0253 TaxID=2567881 RepID=UPI0010CD53D4|nr:molybdate ABC transporter substrate-binding protein [Citricoccus sp. SGAir0253]QCU77447.1 molybdate ABC transporter substrate-binding protein [Citricoccus sp. SGAir0253]
MSGPARAALLAVLLAAALAGCTAGSGTTAAPRTTLTVFAAASLGDALEEIGADFERAHPGVDVRLTVAGSTTLAGQVEAGAPADVVALADEATMDRLGRAGLLVGAPRDVATNELALVTPPDDPAGIDSLRDAAAAGVALVACAPRVPCGHAARTLAAHEGLALSPVSEESSVTDVLGKVLSGQADAGLVYATDAARTGGAVREVRLPDVPGAATTAPVAAVAPGSATAQAFVDHVAGEPGQRVLRRHGFGAP